MPIAIVICTAALHDVFMKTKTYYRIEFKHGLNVTYASHVTGYYY